MEQGVIEQIDGSFDEMPEPILIGTAKWIDQFSIRARLPNYYAPEQSRVDHYVISAMPLVQKDILTLLIGLSNSASKNSFS